MTNYKKAKILNDIYKKAKKYKNDSMEDKEYAYDLFKNIVNKLNLDPIEYQEAKKIFIFLWIFDNILKWGKKKKKRKLLKNILI